MGTQINLFITGHALGKNIRTVCGDIRLSTRITAVDLMPNGLILSHTNSVCDQSITNQIRNQFLENFIGRYLNIFSPLVICITCRYTTRYVLIYWRRKSSNHLYNRKRMQVLQFFEIIAPEFVILFYVLLLLRCGNNPNTIWLQQEW